MQTTENYTKITTSEVETAPTKITSYLDKIKNGCGLWFTQNFAFLSSTELFSLSVKKHVWISQKINALMV